MLRTLSLAICLAAAPLTAQLTTLTTQTNGALILNGFAGANSMFVDINVTAPGGIIVSRIDTNIIAGTGSMNVWVTGVGQTFLPNVNNVALWTNAGTANLSAAASGMAQGDMIQPFHLPMGTYGLCLHLVGVQARYINPGSPPTIPLVYSDANLTVDCTLSRVRNCTTADPCVGGSSASPRVPNMSVVYTTAQNIVNFSGTPTRGASPLAVQFTSHALSMAPGGILTYLWDFDGDQITDSTLANPAHTYTVCGDYTVALTIVDVTGSYTETKVSYIQTDLVTPNFTQMLVAPNTVLFTDTSSPAPTSWAWDLNGDSIIDSNLPSPIFVYPAGTAEVSVTLTVTLACRNPVTLTRMVPVASSLETMFNGNTYTTAAATGGAGFFDITVSNPLGIVITSMHVHTRVPAASPQTVNLWINPTTYVANNTVAAPWRMVGTGFGVSRGFGQRTFVQFPGGIYLAPGTYGMAVEQQGNSPYYTNVGGTRTFSNADLSITAGLIMETPMFTSPTIFNPRIWNGTINYTTPLAQADAGYTFFRPGCPGTNGIPTNIATAMPRIGTVATVQIGNLALNAAMFVVGYSRTVSSLGPLPVDLTGFGAPGCSAHVSTDIIVSVGGIAGTATINVPVPNSVALLNLQLYTQALSVDTVNTLGGVVSDAAALIIGQ